MEANGRLDQQVGNPGRVQELNAHLCEQFNHLGMGVAWWLVYWASEVGELGLRPSESKWPSGKVSMSFKNATSQSALRFSLYCTIILYIENHICMITLISKALVWCPPFFFCCASICFVGCFTFPTWKTLFLEERAVEPRCR